MHSGARMERYASRIWARAASCPADGAEEPSSTGLPESSFRVWTPEFAHASAPARRRSRERTARDCRTSPEGSGNPPGNGRGAGSSSRETRETLERPTFGEAAARAGLLSAITRQPGALTHADWEPTAEAAPSKAKAKGGDEVGAQNCVRAGRRRKTPRHSQASAQAAARGPREDRSEQALAPALWLLLGLRAAGPFPPCLPPLLRGSSCL